MSNFWRQLALIASVFLALGATANATDRHSLSEVATVAALSMERNAREQGYSDIEVELRPLDSRLQLANCTQPLSTLPNQSGRSLGQVSVGVRCNGAEPWTIYVRGLVSAVVESPVLAESVARGSLIKASDVVVERIRTDTDIKGIITDVNDILGMEARRNLDPGEVLRFSDVNAPELVSRGQRVELISGGLGLSVRMEGKAVNGGAVGDLVWVDNLTSGKRVQGEVSADGSVVVY